MSPTQPDYNGLPQKDPFIEEEKQEKKLKKVPKGQTRRFLEPRAEARAKARAQRKKDRKFNALSRRFEKAKAEGDQEELDRIGKAIRELNGK